MTKMFHSPGGFVHDNDTTALDVVNHEINELGNNITMLVSQERLKEVKAGNTVWASPDFHIAADFGDPMCVYVEEILATDNDEGFLVVAFADSECEILPPQ